MLQRTSAPPRGPRVPSYRGGRGGIQKRRAGNVPSPVRVDKDGDLVMDASSTDEKRSGRGQIGGSRSAKGPGSGRVPTGPARGGGNAGMQRTQRSVMRGMGTKQVNVHDTRNHPKMATLEVKGLGSSKAASNPDGGIESLLSFLERKASGHDNTSNRAVKIKKSSKKGDSIFITASEEDIALIQRLDTYTFAGATLSIKPSDPASARSADRKKSPEVSSTAVALTEKFRAVLASRYDSNLKLLNLSALETDPGLIGMGLFNGDVTTSKVFPAMMAVCDKLFSTRQEKSEAIVSVTLANNSLSDVSYVTTLAQSLPDIKNLDLSGNAISDLKGLEAWRWKFRQLETLVLIGNPIEVQLPAIKDELMRRYSQLQFLNGVQVRTAEEVEAARRIAQAGRVPVPISGPDFRDIGQIGENFARQFLQQYDVDRPAFLDSFYDDKSTFSLVVNTHSARKKDNNVPVAPWAEYLKHSRSLSRMTRLGPLMNREYRGKEAIQAQWTTLPATRHPDIQTQAGKYIIECHTQPGLPDPTGQNAGGVDGLYLAIHGEFEDKIPNVEKSLRSFSRTFILGPGGPGGPQIRVISDMLTLRAWSPLAQQVAQAVPITQPVPVAQSMAAVHPIPVSQSMPAAAGAQPLASPEMQQREAFARQLTEKSGMSLHYSALCLEETGWDLEKAWAAFSANKQNLPADAFLAGVVPQF